MTIITRLTFKTLVLGYMRWCFEATHLPIQEPAHGLNVNKIYYLEEPVLYILLMLECWPHFQSPLQMPQCGHWLNSAAVRQKPLSLKPNNLFFTTVKPKQATDWMSEGDPWVLINSVEAETEKDWRSVSTFYDNCWQSLNPSYSYSSPPPSSSCHQGPAVPFELFMEVLICRFRE